MGNDNEREWRCRRCTTLLGVERNGRLHLKYKSAQYVVMGPVVAVCRRCSGTNEMTTQHADDLAGDGRAA
ncbi:MAG: hypothetical protein ACHREM_11125 [Polyangiales bacterium]